MAIIKGQTNAKSSGGNSGNDLSPYLIYGIAPTFDDDENVYVYDLDDGDIFIQNIDGEETSISDFVKGQLIYEIDSYGKYLKGIWEFDRIIEGTNKIAVFSYGEIPSTPIIEIDGSQAKNTPNEYSLTLEQYREFIVNDIVKVVFPNDNTLYVYVKAQYEDETAITFSRGEWDSVNSQYIVEKLTLTGTLPSTFDLVHTTEALSSGGKLYSHNICIYRNDADMRVYVFFNIITSSSAVMTMADTISLLQNRNYTDNQLRSYPATGFYINLGVSTPSVKPVVGVHANASLNTQLYWNYVDGTSNNPSMNETMATTSSNKFTFTDIVNEV